MNFLKKCLKIFLALFLFLLLAAIALPSYEQKRKQIEQQKMEQNQLSQSPSNNTKTKKNTKGWQPEKACRFMPDLPMESYQKPTYPEAGKPSYLCESKSLDVSSQNATLLGSLIYKAYGTENLVTQLDLSVEYWEPNHQEIGVITAMYIDRANTLALKATGKKLPESISQNMLAVRPKTIKSGRFTHQLTFKQNAVGMEMHYLIY